MTLIVSPLRHVVDLIARRRPSHVLTLLAPEAIPPECTGIPPERRLALGFNDITVPTAGYIAPDARVVQAIIDFGRAWDCRAPMLVHCAAGISRSTAAAYIIASAYQGAGGEGDLAKRLRTLAPSATPNILMVSLADEILGRSGNMTAAIQAIGRGADAFEGLPFDLEL
ncbi:MAG: protein tyrosine phosphatase [Rhodospirillaceae bacterium]|nr:protein tyrosine phosphatase [Rhodospirillaceae bacterium]